MRLMYPADYDDFKKTIADLCTAVNRPFNDDLARVFWEDLKHSHLSQVRERAKYLRACGKTRFTSNDLRPEPEPAQPQNAYRPQPQISWQERTGNCVLLKFLLIKQGVPESLVPMLVEIKNRIVATAADDDDAAELGDVLLQAFRRAAP
jgi:hypothetical protein